MSRAGSRECGVTNELGGQILELGRRTVKGAPNLLVGLADGSLRRADREQVYHAKGRFARGAHVRTSRHRGLAGLQHEPLDWMGLVRPPEAVDELAPSGVVHAEVHDALIDAGTGDLEVASALVGDRQRKKDRFVQLAGLPIAGDAEAQMVGDALSRVGPPRLGVDRVLELAPLRLQRRFCTRGRRWSSVVQAEPGMATTSRSSLVVMSAAATQLTGSPAYSTRSSVALCTLTSVLTKRRVVSPSQAEGGAGAAYDEDGGG